MERNGPPRRYRLQAVHRITETTETNNYEMRAALMLHYTMALESASHALKPLFEAYKINAEERHEWAAKLRMDPDIAAAQGTQVDELIDRIGKESLFAIAGCIVVTGDNILKAVAQSTFKKSEPDRKAREMKRCFYGDTVRGGVLLGAALCAGANAYRHYEEWAAGGKPYSDTKKILDALGLPYDDEACSRLLELLTPTASGSPWVPSILTYDRFKLEIEIAAGQMFATSGVVVGEETATSAAPFTVTALDGGFRVTRRDDTQRI
jgi:hypothetical protein